MGLSKTQISKLYVTIFGRASEVEGNIYWQQQAGNMSDIANDMLNTQAAKDYFGATLNDNQEFIKFIYKNSTLTPILIEFKLVSELSLSFSKVFFL